MDETDNNPDIIIPPDDSSDTSSLLLETISRDTSSINKLLSETEGENFRNAKLMQKQRKQDEAKQAKKEKLDKKDREERSRFYKAISYPFKKGWEKLTALPGLIKDKVVSKLEGYGLLGKSILGAGSFVKGWVGSIFGKQEETKTEDDVDSQTKATEKVDDVDSQATKARDATEDAQDTRQDELAEEQTAKDTSNYQEQVLDDLDWIAKNMGKQEETKTEDGGEKKKSLLSKFWDGIKSALGSLLGGLGSALSFLGKGLLKGISGLGASGMLAIAAIAGAGMKFADIWKNGLTATAEKDAADFQKRWEEGDWVGMLMHPMDTLSGAAVIAGEKVAEGVQAVVDGISNGITGISEWISNKWDDFMDWLPWPFGKSKDETEKSRNLKAQGLDKKDIEDFEKQNKARSAMNQEAMTVDEYKELKAMKEKQQQIQKQNAEKEMQRQKSTEYRAKHAEILANMKKENRKTMTAEEVQALKQVNADDPRYAQEQGATLEKQDYARLYAKHHPTATPVSKSVPTSAKVEKPELKDTTSTSGGKDSGKTVIVNQGSNNGVAIPDVIGNAGTAALAMSNI